MPRNVSKIFHLSDLTRVGDFTSLAKMRQCLGALNFVDTINLEHASVNLHFQDVQSFHVSVRLSTPYDIEET